MEQSTKVASYIITKTSIPTRREQVMNAVRSSSTPVSRADISFLTKMRLSSVCGRVNELIELGQLVVRGSRFDTDTNREVETLAVV